MDDQTYASTPKADPELIARLGLDNAARRRPLLRLALVAAIILVIAALAYVWLAGSGDRVRYLTQPVSRGALQTTVSATGTLAPRDQVDVGAEVSGRVDVVHVDFNDRVRKGQPLVQINKDQYQAQLSQATASLAQARATAEQADANLKRARRLAVDEAVSRQALEAAIADSDRAKANVAAAQALIDQYRTALAKTTIRSPVDGVVLDRRAEPGQTVIASLQSPVLFTLASDLSHMELDVDIDEADVGQVRPGQAASFTVDAYPARRFKAEFVLVHNSPRTVNGVVTYQGVLWVDNSDGALRPGMTATAEIETARLDDALLIPNAALRFTPPKTTAASPASDAKPDHGRVWVVSGDTLAPRDIEFGLSDGSRTQVLKGDIRSGDALAIDVARRGEGR